MSHPCRAKANKYLKLLPRFKVSTKSMKKVASSEKLLEEINGKSESMKSTIRSQSDNTRDLAFMVMKGERALRLG